MRRALIAGAILLVLSACRASSPTQEKKDTAPVVDMEALTDAFVKGALALAPVTATQAGYHTHNGAALDEQIDDFSAAGIDAQRRFYQDMQRRVAALDTAKLDREQQADVQIIKNNIGLSLLELDTIQAFRHNPTIYVELAGNALYVPYVLNYAPAETRFRHIIKRLEQIPALVQQAKDNLVDAPEVWNRVAREENDGNIGLIDHTLRAAAPASLKEDYARAAQSALTALKDLNAYLAG